LNKGKPAELYAFFAAHRVWLAEAKDRKHVPPPHPKKEEHRVLELATPLARVLKMRAVYHRIKSDLESLPRRIFLGAATTVNLRAQAGVWWYEVKANVTLEPLLSAPNGADGSRSSLLHTNSKR
jgi:hypothetical protein